MVFRQLRGELLLESKSVVRVLFAHAANRAKDPVLVAATSILSLQGQVATSSIVNPV